MPKPIESILTGKEIEVPNVIKDMLVDGEKVLHAVQQARIKQFITPDNIIVTNKRVIVHRPRLFGLRQNIEDFKFIDMANTVVDHGIIQSSIKIKMRFQPNEIVLEGIPKDVSREIFKNIQDGIAGRLGTVEPSAPIPIMPSSPEPEIPSPEMGMPKEELLSILQTRYITGEISKKEYQEMKKELVGSKKATKKQSKNLSEH